MCFLKKPMVRRSHLRRGAAAAEFALVAPFLAFIFLIATDFCRLFFALNTITNSARNGALWASDPLANGTVTPCQSPYGSVAAAALADANNLNPPLTSTNITQTSGTDGQGNPTVVVTVQYQFSLITSYLGFGTVTLSRQATMRVAPMTPN
jgi:Flp pilus assembly protein TadG